MSSTDLITYLNYISTWETESDANIDPLISEHRLFLNLGDFDSDTAVNSEFDDLYARACDVRDRTIAADATQIAADVAAVAAIWSFGLGMAAFAALEAAEVIQQRYISSKSQELNDKLKTIDADISTKINPSVNNYISAYKTNNNIIAAKAPAGLDTRTCRSNLLQFIAEVEKRAVLDADHFRQWAGSARRLYNSSEINKVYDALDDLNMSSKTDADISKFLNVLAGLDYPKTELSIVRGFCIAIMFYKLKIANTKIEALAKEAGIPLEEVETNVFKTMDAVGKFVTVIAVVMSVVDIVFNILDIINVVEQCQKMCDELNNTVRVNYSDYFNGIKVAAKQYKAAISGSTDPVPAPSPDPEEKSAGNDVKQMLAQIARYGSITQFGNRVARITGNADNPNQTTGIASKTDHGFGGQNGSWEVGNWGDTLKFSA